VIFGDAEGVARGLVVELQRARRDRRAGEAVPGAGGVIVGDAAMQRDAGAVSIS
jgi:hypothetical protein